MFEKYYHMDVVISNEKAIYYRRQFLPVPCLNRVVLPYSRYRRLVILWHLCGWQVSISNHLMGLWQSCYNIA
jgi:hypothetical protein